MSIVLRNDSNVYLKSDVIVNKYLVEGSNLRGVLACTKGILTWNMRRMIDEYWSYIILEQFYLFTFFLSGKGSYNKGVWRVEQKKKKKCETQTLGSFVTQQFVNQHQLSLLHNTS